MRNEVVRLITKTADGASVKESPHDVYADKKSVNRSEFYAAYAAGLNLKYIFVVDTEDYEDADEPQMLEYHDRRYNIVRSYETDEGTELSVISVT